MKTRSGMTTIIDATLGWPSYFQWKPPEEILKDLAYVELSTGSEPRYTTKTEIRARVRDEKMRRQTFNLRLKRRTDTVTKPALIWVFYISGLIYGGWHIYIRTLEGSVSLGSRNELIEQAMMIYPCGFLPDSEFRYDWAKAFQKQFPAKRPRGHRREGAALCRAVYSSDGIVQRIEPVNVGI